MAKSAPIQGAFTAIVTPFTADGERIDFDAFDALVAAQIEAGIDGLVPCGTTGESPTLDDREQVDVIRHTVSIAAKRVPVIAGASSNCTKKCTELARQALEAGADGVMVVMPYYNKPTQDGLLAHIVAVARAAAGAPVVVYNIPGRCAVDLSVETLVRAVRAAPNVVGLKDASGGVLRVQSVVREFGSDFSVMSGEDALTLGMMACGAKGVISVTANVYPAQVARVCRCMREGRLDEARAFHLALMPVHDVMFIETSPGPVKAALAHRSKIQMALRLPMVPPSQTSQQRIAETMARFDAGDHR